MLQLQSAKESSLIFANFDKVLQLGATMQKLSEEVEKYQQVVKKVQHMP